MSISFRKKPIPLLLFITIYILSLANMRNGLALGQASITGLLYISLFASLAYLLMKFTVTKFPNSILLKYSLVLCVSILPSVAFSDVLDVSIIKGMIFMSGFLAMTLISVSLKRLTNETKYDLFTSVRNINRFFLFLSLPIYISGLGYPRNDTGFAGVLNHPQAFGVFMILVILIELFGRNINYGKKYLSVLSISTAFVFALMTESRLSIISILLLIGTYSILFGQLTKKNIALCFFMLLCAIIFSNQIYSKANHVITKSGRSSAVGLKALQNSRGSLFEASIKNFTENPITGIGFQISNGKYGHYDMQVTRSSSFNIPIKASVEKGVFWSALLEEVGLFGSLGFITFIIILSKNTCRKMSFLTLLTIFLIGCGESFYFSIGGLGTVVWLTLFLIYSTSRTTRENQREFIKTQKQTRKTYNSLQHYA